MENELNHGKIIDFVEARNRRHLSGKKLEIDVERYQGYLDENNLSDEQRKDFVQALWTVIVAFVDLGYGVHPVQAAGAEIVSISEHRPLSAKQNPEFEGAAHV
ncbi:hypothetical protein [Thalassobius sp. Cn5-15]|uniref:hypothetical protein n=1 Tax=Thalassobius sp. Cn5-15 TaxID=2917763 RepID=UPI001EF2979A|nr:hypothetical protein [Thalassobius sp. Cn5-15]MCG7493896.1 hypothetical protein [Thalassobius sp. Cn5-15]